MIGVCEKCSETAIVDAFDIDKGFLCEFCASRWRKLWSEIESRFPNGLHMSERVIVWEKAFSKFTNNSKERVVFT